MAFSMAAGPPVWVPPCPCPAPPGLETRVQAVLGPEGLGEPPPLGIPADEWAPERTSEDPAPGRLAVTQEGHWPFPCPQGLTEQDWSRLTAQGQRPKQRRVVLHVRDGPVRGGSLPGVPRHLIWVWTLLSTSLVPKSHLSPRKAEAGGVTCSICPAYSWGLGGAPGGLPCPDPRGIPLISVPVLRGHLIVSKAT